MHLNPYTWIQVEFGGNGAVDEHTSRSSSRSRSGSRSRTGERKKIGGSQSLMTPPPIGRSARRCLLAGNLIVGRVGGGGSSPKTKTSTLSTATYTSTTSPYRKTPLCPFSISLTRSWLTSVKRTYFRFKTIHLECSTFLFLPLSVSRPMSWTELVPLVASSRKCIKS